MRRAPIVTIDGPSGAGKTTASRRLAARAGLTRIDTGAMYRAMALAASRRGISWKDGEALGRMCRGIDLSFRREGEEVRTLLDGEDVSEEIRTPEMSLGASDVSAHAPVREAMVALQRKMGEAGGVVLEGRDTGTVVFPGADRKFFLDAQAAVRALRRYREAGGKGQSFEEVYRDVVRRDVQDSGREHSPLRVAEGAVYIDSTVRSEEEVVEEMIGWLSGRAASGRAGEAG